jgi:hypothetical protein
MYDPTLGRFITRDPTRKPGGSIDLYEYASSNPAGHVDPSGKGSEPQAAPSAKGSVSPLGMEIQPTTLLGRFTNRSLKVLWTFLRLSRLARSATQTIPPLGAAGTGGCPFPYPYMHSSFGGGQNMASELSGGRSYQSSSERRGEFRESPPPTEDNQPQDPDKLLNRSDEQRVPSTGPGSLGNALGNSAGSGSG